MDPIQETIENMESREPEDKFLYREVAKRFGVDRTTLLRGHQGQQRTSATKPNHQQLLSPRQESALAQYVKRCTRRCLPPTREIVFYCLQYNDLLWCCATPLRRRFAGVSWGRSRVNHVIEKALERAPSPPSRTTRRGRNVNLPKKLKC
jgi:hypothetical protein